eukprot:TRINITY_DN20730_c0_g1_i2.p1 TRINITY_DN20730_c0_g1~~TRINITY_DN20730_c0_g1_i2.p1  ORF type:complete len:1655 (+),score=292.53 TRINITY_DN20730_c0_g1_i2:723-4967(+)
MAHENNVDSITLDEFQAFVNRAGGMRTIFCHRRRRAGASRNDICCSTGVDVGSRVRAHFYSGEQKSKSWREAQVLAVGVVGPVGSGVLLEFGFDAIEDGKPWMSRQVVPPCWVISSISEASAAAALREVGIIAEQQAFWGTVFPQSELRAVERLVVSQRMALAEIRKQATVKHETALAALQKRFEQFGKGEYELKVVLGWVEELAPVLIHVNLDKVGQFLETDEFYRNQFETQTSGGAFDDGNQIRRQWESQLFGEAYQDVKPFERPKYGVLNVTNDYRGVASAAQYGDSFLVLKDVRLRCTFASRDSGGLTGSSLAVCDKYAHVLLEYSDAELKEIIGVAVAAMTEFENPGRLPRECWPMLLRGGTEDPLREWITVGYPILAQSTKDGSEGRYYFEVLLGENAKAPQVGLLSTAFAAKPGVTSTEGVGDDEHGWALDPEHVALFHAGQDSLWSGPRRHPGKITVIGVAVDIAERRIWFVSDGEWSVEPAFNGAVVPEDVSVFPALSVEGRAAFIFGPRFRYPPEAVRGFKQWPGSREGVFWVDCPSIGDSTKLHIYKEAQIHGEVSLKLDVQRLVANNKYRQRPKSHRSWGVRVSGSAKVDGKYDRVGAHDDAPLYSSVSGAVIYWDKAASHWRINDTADFSMYLFQALAVEDDPRQNPKHPPRIGWVGAPENNGFADVDVFREAMTAAGVEDCEPLVRALSGKTRDGETVVFRIALDTSFEAEWSKIPSPPEDSDTAWGRVLKAAQRRLLASKGMPEAVVFETAHPYKKCADSWTRSVRIDGAKGLKCHFCSRSRTLDNYSRFQATSGSPSLTTAGPGARVEITAMIGARRLFGSVIDFVSEGCGTARRKIALDRDDLSVDEAFHKALPTVDESIITAWGAERPESVAVFYANGVTVGDEIAAFVLDRCQPLAPIGISAFRALSGPAQASGVKQCWRLDLAATIFGPSRTLIANLEGRGFGEPPQDIADIFQNLDEVIRRLDRVRSLTNVILVFCDAVKVRLLPEVHVSYHGEQTVGSELKPLDTDDESGPKVTGFVSKGPAYTAGLRPGWTLSVDKTCDRYPGSCIDTAKDTLDVWSSLQESLLASKELTLVFELLASKPVEHFSGYGQRWPAFEVPQAESIDCTFETDGDGDDNQRWGVAMLVLPGDKRIPGSDELAASRSSKRRLWYYKPWEEISGPLSIRDGPTSDAEMTSMGVEPGERFSVSEEQRGEDGVLFLKLTDGRGWLSESLPDRTVVCFPEFEQEAVDSFFDEWFEIIQRTNGDQTTPIVERGGWDETRLLALCQRHGWEFEWIAEDGERQRRIAERQSKTFVPRSIVHADRSRPDGLVQCARPRELGGSTSEFIGPAALEQSQAPLVLPTPVSPVAREVVRTQASFQSPSGLAMVEDSAATKSDFDGEAALDPKATGAGS